MYVDASVIVSILIREVDAERYKLILDANRGKGIISPVTVYEAAVSLARAKTSALGRKPTTAEVQAAFHSVQSFLVANGITETAISPEIGKLAVEAASVYGKIVGHSADLNFGDCFAYACSKANGVLLLFKGNDFGKTDIGVMV